MQTDMQSDIQHFIEGVERARARARSEFLECVATKCREAGQADSAPSRFDSAVDALEFKLHVANLPFTREVIAKDLPQFEIANVRIEGSTAVVIMRVKITM